MDIATIDMRRVLDESHPGKAAKVELEAQFQANKAQFETLRARFEAAPDDKKQEAYQEAMDFEQSSIAAFEQDRAKRRQALVEQAKPLIQALAKERQLDAIVEASALLFAKPALDVTDVLIERLNQG